MYFARLIAERAAYFRRYCGVSRYCRILARKAAPCPTCPALEKQHASAHVQNAFVVSANVCSVNVGANGHLCCAESSKTTTSSILNIAAARATWPATAVASSSVCALSTTDPGTAIDTVDGCFVVFIAFTSHKTNSLSLQHYSSSLVLSKFTGAASCLY